MPKYKYCAVNNKGQVCSSSILATDPAAATAQLQKAGFFCIKINQREQLATPRDGNREKDTFVQSRVRRAGYVYSARTRQIMFFTRQLAVLINAGLPILKGLQIIQQQEKSRRLKKIVTEVAGCIQRGHSLTSALCFFPRVFNQLYVNMVRAGEAGGILDQVLLRLANYLEESSRLRTKIVNSLIYPAVVLASSVAVVMFLALGILPKFKEIFTDSLGDVPLPPLTRAVINVGNYAGIYVLWIMAAPGVVVAALIMLRASAWGKLWRDRFFLHLPIVGNLLQKVSLSRFLRTLGTLMAAGVPIIDALRLGQGTISNAVLSKAFHSVRESIEAGQTMTSAMTMTKLFPPLVTTMVEVGEQSGNLSEVLIKIADIYDQETEAQIARTVGLVEPSIILILAVMVGIIAAALFLPLSTIIGRIS